jgi:hypothetical protein
MDPPLFGPKHVFAWYNAAKVTFPAIQPGAELEFVKIQVPERLAVFKGGKSSVLWTVHWPATELEVQFVQNGGMFEI